MGKESTVQSMKTRQRPDDNERSQGIGLLFDRSQVQIQSMSANFTINCSDSRKAMANQRLVLMPGKISLYASGNCRSHNIYLCKLIVHTSQIYVEKQPMLRYEYCTGKKIHSTESSQSFCIFQKVVCLKKINNKFSSKR